MPFPDASAVPFPARAPTKPLSAERRVLSLLDATLLQASGSPGQAATMAELAVLAGVPAVCVPLASVDRVAQQVRGRCGVATVVNFPSGDGGPDLVAWETEQALAAGATEIDLVYPWRLEHAVFSRRSVGRILDAAHRTIMAGRPSDVGLPATLKVILETGAMSPDLWERACARALDHGADFLKTSTGMIPGGATREAVMTLAEAAAEAEDALGRRCGVKVSGGVGTLQQALAYADLVEQVFGRPLDAQRLRIGSSRLLEPLWHAVSSSADTVVVAQGAGT